MTSNNPNVAARLDWLQSIVNKGPTALFATVSGAHLYGFESPDSDYDLRGAFVAPLDEVLRMGEPNETISVIEMHGPLELDWVAHDVLKFARMLTRRNGYVLEQLFSPHVVLGGSWLDELRKIGTGCIVSHLFHHYKGFAGNQCKLLSDGDQTVKRLLYCYRVLLTGIHVLRTGRIEAHLPSLLQDHDLDRIPALIERKRNGAEKGRLEAGEAESHMASLQRLSADLEAAFSDCTLPAEVSSYEALDDFVVRVRMELGNG